MSRKRIALIFDDQVRPDTTGVYCLAALRQMTNVEHFRPSRMSQLPRNGFDLYLSIDDGLDYLIPPHARPLALWAIDTHLNPARIIRRARQADAVFAAQRNGARLLTERGVKCLGWLPLACDPGIHRKHDVPKEHDACFVGRINCPQRAQLLTALLARHRNTFVGSLLFDEMARKYSQSRIVFNRSVRNDLNMRVFEALACGSLLVTNDLADNGQAKLFIDGIHLVTYHGEADLLDKVAFYIEHPIERERIAAAGQTEVLAHHTYLHRMEKLLAVVDSSRPADPDIANGSRSPGVLADKLATGTGA